MLRAPVAAFVVGFATPKNQSCVCVCVFFFEGAAQNRPILLKPDFAQHMTTTLRHCLCRCQLHIASVCVDARVLDAERLTFCFICGWHRHKQCQNVVNTHTQKHNKRRARTRIRWETLQIEAWRKRYFGVSGIRPDSLVVKHPVCEFRGDPGSTPGRGFFSSCAFALVSSIPLFCLCSFGQFFHTQHAHTTALIQRHAATAP